MIIIQSSSSDRSTNDIIDWLMYHSSKFVRLNDDIIIENLEITLETGQLLLNNINISNCAYLYRRGDFHFPNELRPISQVNKNDNWILAQKLSKENLPILAFINSTLKDKNYRYEAGFINNFEYISEKNKYLKSQNEASALKYELWFKKIVIERFEDGQLLVKY